MKTSELIQLCKDVLSVEPGKSLLQALEDDVTRPIMSPDEAIEPSTNKIMTRVGQHDLVMRLKSFIDVTPEQLKAIKKREDAK